MVAEFSCGSAMRQPQQRTGSRGALPARASSKTAGVCRGSSKNRASSTSLPPYVTPSIDGSVTSVFHDITVVYAGALGVYVTGQWSRTIGCRVGIQVKPQCGMRHDGSLMFSANVRKRSCARIRLTEY